MTKQEGKIRNLVLRKKGTGYKFLRQKPIGNYILDFYCHSLKLGIEIDGPSHEYTYKEDEKRTQYLEKLGIKIIRYTNKQIDCLLEAVIINLHTQLEERAVLSPFARGEGEARGV